MDKKELEDYINKLIKIEKSLSSDDDDFDLEYTQQLDDILDKLNKEMKSLSESEDSHASTYLLDVRIKKLKENAVIPSYSKDGDAGMDLTSTDIISNTTDQITYGTGIALEIPTGYVGLVFPRSSIKKYELQLSNSVGVIDSGYRGEIQVTFNKTHSRLTDYKIGDRVAQIVILPYPRINLIETSDLTITSRGTGGFGSTGT